MQYIAFAEDMDRGEVMLCAPVRLRERDYLQEVVVPALQPLSVEDYANGPAAILQIEARWSYILDGRVAYWCIEWPPGLLVLRFAAATPMQWAAITVAPTTAAPAAYDESADEPSYRLIYEAWDAQFEGGVRDGWREAPEAVVEDFELALERVRQIEDELEARYGDDTAAFNRWLQACQANPIWQGTLPSSGGN